MATHSTVPHAPATPPRVPLTTIQVTRQHLHAAAQHPLAPPFFTTLLHSPSRSTPDTFTLTPHEYALMVMMAEPREMREAMSRVFVSDDVDELAGKMGDVVATCLPVCESTVESLVRMRVPRDAYGTRVTEWAWRTTKRSEKHLSRCIEAELWDEAWLPTLVQTLTHHPRWKPHLDLVLANVSTETCPMGKACVKGGTAPRELALSGEVALGAVDGCGLTPFMWTCVFGKTELAMELIGRDASKLGLAAVMKKMQRT